MTRDPSQRNYQMSDACPYPVHANASDVKNLISSLYPLLLVTFTGTHEKASHARGDPSWFLTRAGLVSPENRTTPSHNMGRYKRVEYSLKRERETDGNARASNVDMNTTTTRDLLSQEEGIGCIKDLGPFQVSVTRRFLVLALIGSSAMSFLVGHSCRQFLLFEPTSDGDKSGVSFLKSQTALHSPVAPKGQGIPDFVYTGHTFQDGFSRSSGSVFLARMHGTEKVF